MPEYIKKWQLDRRFMYNISLNKNGLTFKEIEKKVYKMGCDEVCNVLKSVLEALDEKYLRKEILKDIEIRELKRFI